MSYCRFSSDDWKCELYCYPSGAGYIIHVAGRRLITKIHECEHLWDSDDLDKYFKCHETQMKELENAEYEDITLPHTGESFNEPTEEKMYERILYLHGLGYRVPEYLIKDAREAVKEIGE